MKATIRPKIIHILLGLILAWGSTSFAQEFANFERHGRLRVEGARIVAEDGTPVVLRGGALMNLLWYTYTPQMIDYLKSTGANVVRIPLGWERSGLQGGYEVHMNRFYALADHSFKLGLYVIADFHAVADPANPGAQAMARTFFQDVAKRYGKTGQVIYEIFNEPTGKSSYSEKVPWSTIKSYSIGMIDWIRALDPASLIIVPTATWSQEIDVPLVDPVLRPNIAYAFHFYATLHLFKQRNYAIAEKLPIVVTEWAAQTPENSDGSIDFESFQAYVDWMNELSISWMAWSYSDEREPYGWFVPGSLWDGRVQDSELRPWGRMVRDLIDDGLLNQTFTWPQPTIVK